MSIALWAAYLLPGGEIICDEADKYQLAEYQEALDTLCEQFGVSPLSEIIDYSAAAESFDEESDFLEDDIDEESNMNEPVLWVSPRDAIYILDTLLTHLSNNPELLYAPVTHVEELLYELQECISFAQNALDDDSDFFHLKLVI